ncbi:MAG: hypothetical protein ACI8UO_004910 [Verrucomicrobiales bacterium]|jgi:hypothetical protein
MKNIIVSTLAVFAVLGISQVYVSGNDFSNEKQPSDRVCCKNKKSGKISETTRGNCTRKKNGKSVGTVTLRKPPCNA